ncbi:MAG TPA: hypothetical protein VJ385_12610 [Fibrobacteria bacterium]|nr:hypothetical protein [Fibrobacteria bacterium]
MSPPPFDKSNPKNPFGGAPWPKGGGGVRRPATPAEAAEPEPPPPPVAEEKPKEKPKVVLSNPKWSKDKARFNEKVTLTVEGTLPEELKGITKVDFQAFAVQPDGKKESIAKAEGHLKDGKAGKEITLFLPQFKTPEGKPPDSCRYVFTAKHRDSTEVESPALDVRQFAAKVRFEKEEGWVGETVKVLADTILSDDVEVALKLTLSHKAVAEAKVKAKGGKLEYTYHPCLCGVEAKDGKLPESVPVQAEFQLEKEKAFGAKNYKLKLVKDADWETFSKDYSWNNYSVHSEFKQKFDGLQCKIQVKEDVLKAWGGYWVKMTGAGITGLAGGCPYAGYRWGRVHGAGMVPNQYHDGTAWKAFPAGFVPSGGEYSAVGFQKSGAKYVQINGTGEWPEAFADYDFHTYAKKRAAWVDDTHKRFSEKFKLRPKTCSKAADKEGCGYKVDLTLEMKKVETAGAHSIALVPGYGRSNAAIFFYGETRVAVAAHEVGHLVGLPDEYAGGATDTTQADGDGLASGIDNDSLMGANLTNVKKRHYVNFLAVAKKLWKAKTSRDLEFMAGK